jgi:hypothetical protein
MNLKDAINYMKEGVKRYRVIIINQDNSAKYYDECKELNIKPINLSLKLSELLSGLSEEEKAQEARDILENYLESLNDDIIALDNVDYIFSPEVGNLNPVHNLNYYSRNNQIIILFLKARKIGDELIYSEEGLPDNNRMDISENKCVLGWDN